METRPLGRTGLNVSAICLGTMTFGEQNTEAEGHVQLDYALDHGVNFLDTAELYPVTPRRETQGRTEEIIGSWMKARGTRDKVIVASKVVGPSPAMDWFRGPGHRLDRANITAALDASLARLQTDVIDLYYLHWPDRKTNFFGQLGYTHDPDDDAVALEESLSVLADAQEAGKIRHIGLSNETPWGLMHALHLAETRGLPRVACVQNPYNLLNRSYEVGMAECSIREEAGLCAYSPLGFGTLSGKYLGGAMPPGARITLFPDRYTRYTRPRAVGATEAYVALARDHGLDPAQMALAYVTSRPFVTSNIIGATTMAQLESNIASAGLDLPEAVLEGIEAIHAGNPNPAP
ncbi:Oxidoreductase, aldo/keto reductase family [Caenispirillum salinarum AK4]|uniref:Protein tas n=1 Tax=Caenispirillum salinarum AK4 TaxID=1238182 RepID=K9HCX5_9PROT|nr:NADP(H)-dependent aldo-keto reductase [Caenispirillum salinarum]EKV28393.1 Oxidoreductase, aldo/keto reductase family [Caenispirillum salinarum AK4]